MSGAVGKSQRKPNWTKDEQKALVTAITPLYGRLFGRLSNTTTNEVKSTLWDQVHEQVNAVSTGMTKPCERGLQEIKDKFTDFKSKTKKKTADILKSMKRTGGGERLDDGDWDQLMDSVYSLDLHEKIMAKLIGREGVVGIAGFNLDSSTATDEPIVEFPGDSQQLVVYDPVGSKAGVNLLEMPATPQPSSSGNADGVPAARNLFATPEPSSNRKRKGEELLEQLLESQQETTAQTKRVADALEQLVELKRNKYNF